MQSSCQWLRDKSTWAWFSFFPILYSDIHFLHERHTQFGRFIGPLARTVPSCVLDVKATSKLTSGSWVSVLHNRDQALGQPVEQSLGEHSSIGAGFTYRYCTYMCVLFNDGLLQWRNDQSMVFSEEYVFFYQIQLPSHDVSLTCMRYPKFSDPNTNSPIFT